MTFRMLAALAAGSVALIAATSAQAGNPVGGIGVSVEQSPGGIASGSGQTDAKGSFTIANVRGGNYIVKLSGRPVAGKTGGDLVLTVNGRTAALTCEAGVCRSQAISLSGNVSGSVQTSR